MQESVISSDLRNWKFECISLYIEEYGLDSNCGIKIYLYTYVKQLGLQLNSIRLFNWSFKNHGLCQSSRCISVLSCGSW